MTEDVIDYLRYIAILEHTMSFVELSSVQEYRPQRLNSIFSTSDLLQDALGNINYLAVADVITKDNMTVRNGLENKEDTMSIEIEDGLFTVNIQNRLVHNLTLAQATAIAELHLLENDFPNPVIVFQQTVKSSWEFEFTKYLNVRKVVTYAKQYPEAYELLASKSLQDIKELYI